MFSVKWEQEKHIKAEEFAAGLCWGCTQKNQEVFRLQIGWSPQNDACLACSVIGSGADVHWMRRSSAISTLGTIQTWPPQHSDALSLSAIVDFEKLQISTQPFQTSSCKRDIRADPDCTAVGVISNSNRSQWRVVLSKALLLPIGVPLWAGLKLSLSR